MTTTEHPRQPVTITLDRPRTLRFSIAAVRRILTEKGPEYLAGETGGDDLERLSYLAFQGLIHEDPELTQEQVEEMVDFSQVEELTTAVLRALGQDLPQQEGGAGGPTKRGRARPGKR